MNPDEAPTERAVRENCKVCKGYGFLKTLGVKSDVNFVACPLCSGKDFHKMIDNNFDLKK